MRDDFVRHILQVDICE